MRVSRTACTSIPVGMPGALTGNDVQKLARIRLEDGLATGYQNLSIDAVWLDSNVHRLLRDSRHNMPELCGNRLEYDERVYAAHGG